MAKLKPSKGPQPFQAKDLKKDMKVALPCLLLVVGAIALLGLMFSAMLKSSQ